MDTKNETVHDVLSRTVYKPFRIIVEEPMLLAISLYSELKATLCPALRAMATALTSHFKSVFHCETRYLTSL